MVLEHAGVSPERAQIINCRIQENHRPVVLKHLYTYTIEKFVGDTLFKYDMEISNSGDIHIMWYDKAHIIVDLILTLFSGIIYFWEKKSKNMCNITIDSL